MAVTPQTNTTLASIASILEANDNIVICGHVSPDGDCIGSQLALAAALRKQGKNVTCLLAKDEPVEARLLFLPGVDGLVPAASFDGDAHVFVAVDVPTRERMGEAATALHDACDITITLDHHAVDSTMADYTYVDPDAASTTVLVWELAGFLGAQRNAQVATCCYTGLVTDTGRFQYQNTTVEALRAAAAMVEAGAHPADVARAIFQNRTLASVQLEGIAIDRMRFGADGAYVISWLSSGDFKETGAVKADAEPVIDSLRSVAGVRVACVLREQGGEVRGSLRAKDDTDVAAIARSFGGGGHKAAAGFTIKRTLFGAFGQVDEALARFFGAWPLGVAAFEEEHRA